MSATSAAQVTATHEPWYQLSPEEVASRLAVDPARGLSGPEVERRRAEQGSNVLAAKQAETAVQAFLRQYQDLMQIILVGAAVVNQVVTGEVGTTIVLVAHEMGPLEPLISRTVVMHDGRIAYDGPALESFRDVPHAH